MISENDRKFIGNFVQTYLRAMEIYYVIGKGRKNFSFDFIKTQFSIFEDQLLKEMELHHKKEGDNNGF